MQVIRARLKSNRFFEFANHWSTGTLEIFCILERLPQRSDSKRSTERIRWSCWRATRRGHGRRRRRVVTTTTTDRTDWQRQSSTSVHCLEDRGSPADNHVSRSASTPPSADECAGECPCNHQPGRKALHLLNRLLLHDTFITRTVTWSCKDDDAIKLIGTSSSAVAERPRDASCLSVASTLQCLERSLLLLTPSYFGFRFTNHHHHQIA